MDEYLTGNFIFVRVLLNEKITHTIDIIKYINKNLFHNSHSYKSNLKKYKMLIPTQAHKNLIAS
jgi:hypothetical protein